MKMGAAFRPVWSMINIVTSSRANTAEVSSVLCESPLVTGLSFTGSTHVGKILYRQCAGTVKLLVVMEEQFVLGDPTQSGVTCDMVSSSVQAGAGLGMGGGPASDVSPLHYQLIVLTGVTEDMIVFQEEIFNQVIILARFGTEDEALNIANNSRTGLASYLYSNNEAQCWRVGEETSDRFYWQLKSDTFA